MASMIKIAIFGAVALTLIHSLTLAPSPVTVAYVPNPAIMVAAR